MSHKEDRVIEITFTVTYEGTRETGIKIFEKAADVMYGGMPKKYRRATVGTGRDMTQAEFEATLED